MQDNRIFTAAAILLLAIWAGYNLYISYTSPSYCPMGNHSIYSYSNLLPILLIVILAFSLLPRSKSSSKSSSRHSGPSGLSRPPRSTKNVNFDLDAKLDAIGIDNKSENGERIGEEEGIQETQGIPREETLENGGTHGNILPKDMTKDILSIIRENPGITQEELREITGYSASKVSVQVKELEEKGLIRREKYGRTYRIYPQ